MGRQFFDAAFRFVARPVVVLAVCAVAFAGLLRTENDPASATFAAIVIAVVAAVIHLVSRRPAFSVYAALALAATFGVASKIKAGFTGMTLHSFDLVLLGEPRTIAFLAGGYSAYMVPFLALAALGLVAFALLLWREPPRRTGLPGRMMAVAVPVLLLPLALPGWARQDDHHFAHRYVSSFAVSFGELPNLWAEHPLAIRIGEARAAPYAEPYACTRGGPRPDIVIVHAESQLPPEWIGEGWNPALTASFRSHDGAVHRLGVETFGGSSWITASSIMTGLSGADFGWMRQYIASSLTGNAGAALPEILASCGYATTAMLGMDYDQFGLGAFLTSAGMQDVHDESTTGIPFFHQRDSRYFDAMWDLVLRKRGETGAPQLLYVETMSTHSPYDTRLEPETVLDGEPYAASGEANEFIRRLVMARADIEAFKARIARDPGPHGTILLEYGDHRPMIELELGAVDLSDWGSSAYETYFSVNAFGGAKAPALPAHRRTDAAFLGYWLIEASGVASGGLIDEMAGLRERCDGLYHRCPHRDDVDRMLRRRVESGLLALHPLLDTWSGETARTRGADETMASIAD